jgi:hypothetical protein
MRMAAEQPQERVWVIQKYRGVATEYLTEWPTLAERVFTDGAVDSSADMTPRPRRECERWLADKAQHPMAQWRLWNVKRREVVLWHSASSD